MSCSVLWTTQCKATMKKIGYDVDDRQAREFAAGHEEAVVDRVSLTKRRLLKAGWVAPVIAAVSLPASSFVANSSTTCNDPYKC